MFEISQQQKVLSPKKYPFHLLRHFWDKRIHIFRFRNRFRDFGCEWGRSIASLHWKCHFCQPGFGHNPNLRRQFISIETRLWGWWHCFVQGAKGNGKVWLGFFFLTSFYNFWLFWQTELNDTQHVVKVLTPTTFLIGDTSSYKPYISGGIATQVKIPVKITDFG